MKTRKNIFATLILVTAWTAIAQDNKVPPASIGVSPSRVEIEVGDTPASGSATVINMTDEVVQIQTSLVNFDLDENNRFRELPPDAGVLPQAIMLNPVAFAIPPRSSQTVRFAVMPERVGSNGEHRAMLFFSELVDTNQPGVKMRFRLGVPIYAQVGEAEPKAELHHMEIGADMSRLTVDISSTGNTQVLPKGYYLWWPSADYPGDRRAHRGVKALSKNPNRKLPADTIGGSWAGKPVFPGQRRTINALLEPPADVGDYVLAVHLDAGDQSLQRSLAYSPAGGVDPKTNIRDPDKIE